MESLLILGGILSSSIIDCSDWNSATIYVSCSSASPTSQIEARSFISPVISGAFFPVTGSGEQEQSTVGLTDAFTFSVDLAGARRFYVEFEEVGDPTTPAQVTGSAVISHERGMRETVISSSVSGLTNPMTTAGDLLFYNLTPEEDRIAIGNEADVLTVVGGIPVWQAPVPSGGGIDGSLVTPSDGGWTTVGTGTATATSGELNLSTASGATIAMLATAPTSPHFYAIELLARVQSNSLSTGGSGYALSLGFTNAAQDRGYRIRLAQDGQVSDRINTAGAWNFTGSSYAGGLSWSDGTTWLRMIVTNGYIQLYHGTGVGTAIPTTWSLAHVVTTPDTTLIRNGTLNRLELFLEHFAATSGTLDIDVFPFTRNLITNPT